MAANHEEGEGGGSFPLAPAVLRTSYATPSTGFLIDRNSGQPMPPVPPSRGGPASLDAAPAASIRRPSLNIVGVRPRATSPLWARFPAARGRPGQRRGAAESAWPNVSGIPRRSRPAQRGCEGGLYRQVSARHTSPPPVFSMCASSRSLCRPELCRHTLSMRLSRAFALGTSFY